MSIVKRIPEKPLFMWKVSSKSENGAFHIVEYYENNHWECDCLGYQMRKKECRHIRIAKHSLKGLKYYGEDYKNNKLNKSKSVRSV